MVGRSFGWASPGQVSVVKSRVDMKTKHRRELKENEVAQMVAATRQFTNEHGNQLMTLIVAGIVVVAAVFAFQMYRNRQQSQGTGPARAGDGRAEHGRRAGRGDTQSRPGAGGGRSPRTARSRPRRRS